MFMSKTWQKVWRLSETTCEAILPLLSVFVRYPETTAATRAAPDPRPAAGVLHHSATENNEATTEALDVPRRRIDVFSNASCMELQGSVGQNSMAEPSPPKLLIVTESLLGFM